MKQNCISQDGVNREGINRSYFSTLIPPRHRPKSNPLAHLTHSNNYSEDNIAQFSGGS